MNRIKKVLIEQLKRRKYFSYVINDDYIDGIFFDNIKYFTLKSAIFCSFIYAYIEKFDNYDGCPVNNLNYIEYLIEKRNG